MKNLKFFKLSIPKGIASYLALAFLFVLQSSGLNAQNLLNNPSFEINNSDWTTVGSSTDYSPDLPICGSYSGWAGAPSGHVAQSLQNPEIGTTYELDFSSVRYAAGTGWAKVALYAYGTGGTLLGLAEQVVTSATPNTYSISLVVPPGTISLQTWMGTGNGASLRVDCMDLRKAGAVNCNDFINGEFDNGVTDWITSISNGASGAFTIDNSSQLSGTNSVRANISNGGSEDHYFKIFQLHAVDDSKTYNISFEAKATANREIDVWIQKNSSPYTVYFNGPEVAITTTAQTYTLNNINLSGSTSEARVGFMVGGSSHDVWIDNVVFEEATCAGSGQINYSCDDGKTLDHYAASCNNGTASISIPNIGQVEEQSIEVIYKDCDPGSSITVTGTGGNTYTLNEVSLSGNSPDVHSYRGTFTNVSSTLSHTAVCGSCSTNDGLQSILSFVVRNVDQQRYFASKFVNKTGYCDIVSETLTIPTDDHARDMVLYVPISEVTSDGRYITVKATDNTGTVTESATIFNHDPAYGPCCLAVVEIPMLNVPANASSINFEIITDVANNPNSSTACGQSWVLAATVYADINCNCTNPPTANAGPDVVICSGDQVTLTAGSSGGTGTKTYQWNNGVNGSSQNVSPTATTSYIVTATDAAGCDDIDAVNVTVVTNYTNPGVIAGNEIKCAGYNPTNISSTSLPSGGSGGTTIYVWQQRTFNCTTGAYGSYSNIAGATAAAYNPPAITATTQYRRVARRSSCFTWVYTAPVTKTVVSNFTDGGTIGSDESKCASFNPANITNITSPSGGCGGTPFYYWQARTYNCANNTYGDWTNVGTNALTFNPGAITQTTHYRRLAYRVAGCDPYWAVSNTVVKEVVENYTNGGTIAADESQCSGYDPALITSAAAPSGGCGGTADIRWYKWELNCVANNWGTASLVAGATGVTYNPGPITVTTRFRRYARRGNDCVGTNGSWVLSNFIIKEVVDQYTDAGTIAGDEIECTGYDPALITSSASPSGGCGGTSMSLWQQREFNCATNAFGSWTTISGVNALTYNPGAITTTTEYRRLSRRSAGCTPGWLYSNVITKEVVVNYTDGGTIGIDESKCSAFTPATINSVAAPSGGCGGTPFYYWQFRTYNCANNTYTAWAKIGGNTITLAPTAITATTEYRRLAYRTAGCDPYWAYSNTITKEVVQNYTDGGAISAGQAQCGGFNPPLIASIADPSGECGGIQDVRWYMWTQDCATGVWSSGAVVPGATSMTYNPPAITVSTRYRRYARRGNDCVGTNGTWVVSDFANFYVQQDLPNGGTITADQESCGTFNPANLIGTDATGACAVQSISYLWQYRVGLAGDWIDIASATAKNYNPPVIAKTRQYRRKASSEACGEHFSNVVTMLINNAPSITLENDSYCAGSNVELTPDVCISYPDLSLQRPLDNAGWANAYQEGGHKLIGDGSLCFTLESTTNAAQMLGLNNTPLASDNFTDINYAIYTYIIPSTNTWTVQVRENGVTQGNISAGVDITGVEMCIRRTGTQVEYLMDGVVLKTSLVASNTDLFFDNCYLGNNDATWSGGYSNFEDIKLCGETDVALSWNTGASTNDLTVSAAGTYTLTATDQNGCTVSAQSVVTQDALPNATVNKNVDLSCLRPISSITSSAVYPNMTWTLSDVTLGTSGAPCGNNYITLNGSDPYGIAGQSIGGVITAGTTYEHNFQYRASGTGSGYARIVFYDAAWSNLGVFTTQLTNTGTWTSEVVSAVAPANAVNVHVGIVVTDTRSIDYDCVDASAVGGANFVLNPSFEIESPYQWSGPNGPRYAQRGFYVTEPGTYSVTVTDPNTGCTATSSVVVTQDNAEPVSSISGPAQVCATENGVYTATGNNVTYSWDFKGGVTADGDTDDASETVTWPNSLAGTTRNIMLTVTGANGCTKVYTHDVLITSEVFANAGPDIEMCQGGTVDLGAVNSGPAGATYTWTPNLFLDNNSASHPSASPPFDITYTLTTALHGCTRTDQVTVSVDVDLNPIADAGPDKTAGVGHVVSIGGSPTGTVPPADPSASISSYTWSPTAGLDNPNIANPNLTVGASGQYQVIVETTTGCRDTSVMNIIAINYGAVSGNVSEDIDNDDAGEVNLSGILITLINKADGSTYDSKVTNANGNYLFEDVLAGNYTVVEDDSSLDATYRNVRDGDESNDGDPTDLNYNSDDEISVVVAPGETDRNNDFIEERIGRIRGVVREDTDNDDVGEVVLSGIAISLIDKADGSVYATAVTNAGGAYNFFNVETGNYTVVEDDSSLAASYRDVLDGDSSDDGDPTDDTYDNNDEISVVLAPGEYDNHNDFLEEQIGRIRGRVMEDTDNDDVGELALQGITLTLIDKSDGSTVGTTTTTANGFYNFFNVEVGNYTVVEDDSSLPASYTDVKDGDATDDGDPTDVTFDNDNEISVVMTPGELDYNNDFLEEQSGSISGTVTEDTDNDDDGDAPLAGVPVSLVDKNTGLVVGNTTTNASGAYSFSGLPAGSYTVLEDDTSLAATYVNVDDGDDTDDGDATDGTFDQDDAIPVILAPGENDADNNFTEERLGRILGNVSEDTNNDDAGEVNLVGITVNLIDKATGALVDTKSTNANGNYAFINLPAGNYTVVEDDSSLAATYRNVQDGDESDDGDASDLVFNQDDEISVTLTPGETDRNNDFIEEQVGRIRGTVKEDTDNDDVGEVALQGIVLNLIDKADGSTYATTVTAANGAYNFYNVEAGNYTVVEDDSSLAANYRDVRDGDVSDDGDATDVTFDSNDEISVTITPGEFDNGNDFVEEQGGMISGTVSVDTDNDDDGDAPISGIQISLVDKSTGLVTANTVTDNTGAYSFAGIAPGIYTVLENDDSLADTHADVKDGDESGDGDANDLQYDTNDAITVVLAPGENDADNNFIEEEFVSIGNLVWYDSSNGASNSYDAGVDQPMPGVRLNLMDGSGNPVIDPATGAAMTTLTNNAGQYLFDKLLPGVYMVEMIYPTAMTVVAPNFVANDATDSDGIDRGNGKAMSGSYTLVNSMDDMTVDFGLINIVVGVELLDFYGSYSADRDLNALVWTTETEINNDKFVIERSFNNANDFVAIETVDGSGTSSTSKAYKHDDKDVGLSGTYYYRLQQVDFDGKTTTSNTIAIKVNKALSTEVRVYPNPARDFATLEIATAEEAPVDINVFDFSGRLVNVVTDIQGSQNGIQKVNLDLQDLPAGTYMVRTKIGARTFIKKLVITKN